MKKPRRERGPSRASLREIPEVDFSKATWRRNPYAGRIAAEGGYTIHVDGRRPKWVAMKRRPTAPGEMLLEEFLKPAGMTQLALAEKMGVPVQRVNAIIAGRRAVTAETALLLGRAVGTTAELWMNLQVALDLWEALERLTKRRRLA